MSILLRKPLAALVPSVAIAYAVYAFFLACVELFVRPAVVSTLLRGPDILAQLLFTPLLAAWSIWVGITISARWNDIRVAQQFGMLASLPSIAVRTLNAYGVIHATLGLGAGLAPALLIIDRLGLAGRVSGIRPRTAHHRPLSALFVRARPRSG